MHDHSQCQSLLGELSEYLDGELDPSLCQEIERHLSECGNCRIMIDTLRKTIVLYRTAGHQDVPGDAKERLYAVLDLERARKAE